MYWSERAVTVSLKPQWRIHYLMWKKTSEKKKIFRVWYKPQAEVRWHMAWSSWAYCKQYFFLFLAEQLETCMCCTELSSMSFPELSHPTSVLIISWDEPTPWISQHENSHHLPHQDEPPKSAAMDWEYFKRQGGGWHWSRAHYLCPPQLLL